MSRKRSVVSLFIPTLVSAMPFSGAQAAPVPWPIRQLEACVQRCDDDFREKRYLEAWELLITLGIEDPAEEQIQCFLSVDQNLFNPPEEEQLWNTFPYLQCVAQVSDDLVTDLNGGKVLYWAMWKYVNGWRVFNREKRECMEACYANTKFEIPSDFLREHWKY